MAAAQYFDQIQKIYIAFYQRPADPGGLRYWAERADLAGGDIGQVINAFASSAEANALYGPINATTIGSVIDGLYLALFNVAPDAAGRQFYIDGFTDGTFTAGTIALAVLEGAQNNDQIAIGNKMLVANEFTQQVDGRPFADLYFGTGTSFDVTYDGADVVAARNILKTVTFQQSTIIDPTGVTAVLKAQIADAGDPIMGQTAGQTYVLTTSTDNFTGTPGDDTFIAGEVAGVSTLTVGDQLNGGQGNDTLDWTQTAAVTGLPVGVVLTSIDTVNVTSGGAITLNTTAGFVGTTALNTNTSGAAQTITAAATHDVVASSALQAANNTVVNGGNDVTVNATGVTTGTTTVGAATAAAGDVVVDVTNSTGGTTTGAIAVTGGQTVTVHSAAANAVGTTVTQSAVVVTGDANTTAVTVNQDASVAAAPTVVGKVAGNVTINDVNAASLTAAGTISTVSLDSYGVANLNSGALTTLNLSGTGGLLGITAGALTTPAVNALALNVNGLVSGVIAMDVDYKTLNVAGNTAESTIANLSGAGVTVLNIAGDAKVNLTAQTLAAAKTINVTNTAGASLGTALANDVLFTGGVGADSIAIGATTKTIDMGAGDDVVTLSAANLGAGGSVSGGLGTDTLVANLNGSSFSANPAIGSFEVLRVAGLAAQGNHNANGFAALEIGATAAATTFTTVAANVGLTILAGPTGGTTVALANATGPADVFNLALMSDASLAAGSVTLAGVESVNITNTDSLTTVASGINSNTLTLVATDATSVVVTGNAGLNITNAGNAAITSFDASGIQGAAADAAALGVTFVSANVTVGENVSIKGGSGHDVLTGSATANDTIYGGAGDDTMVFNGGSDVFYGESGADSFVLAAVGTKTDFLTLGDALVGDTIDFSGVSSGIIANTALGAKLVLGGGATLDQYLDTAAAGNGGGNALVKWFQFGTDTYVVLDNTAAATFAGTDAVVKLTGVVDLTASTLAGEILTIV